MSPIHPWWRPVSRGANARRQTERVAYRQTRIGPLVADAHDTFTQQFEALRAGLHDALGARVLALDHIGSTAVPGLLAKPVVDLDLTVADVEAEDDYVADLERAGWRLLFRDDVAGDPHRQLSFADPNANLHVWSPGAIEPQRHRLLVQWLRTHPRDRARYAATKRSALEADNYNDHKSELVYDLYERAFAADPAHAHDPHPRR